MGWTGKPITYYKMNGSVDRKAECEEYTKNWPGHSVLKSSMVGTTYYAAIKNTSQGKNEVFALIIATTIVKNGNSKELHYKDMSEEMGPNEDHCPISILKLLTPTQDEISLNWRKRCYANHGKKMPESFALQALF